MTVNIKSFVKTNGLQFLGILVAILISFIIFWYRDKFIHFQNFGYLGLFIFSVLGNATVFVPVPNFPAVFAMGSFLNPVLVAFSVSLGSAIGELTGYLAGISGNHFLKNNSKFIKVESWMKKFGLWTILFLALIPNFIFDTAGIIAGASKISVYKFLLVAWIGKFLRYIIIALSGYLGFKLMVFSS